MDRPFPAYDGNEPYVFVSYSHGNSSAVYPELVWLKESGFNIWYDEGIEAGTEWREELAKAIEEARLLVYFITAESVQSQNCRKEVNFAVDQDIPIIAIHLEKTDLPSGLNLTLSDRQAILKYEVPKQEYQQKLQARIASYLDQPIIQPAVVKRKKTVPIMAGVAGLIVLVIGLVFYSQQDVQQTAETTTDDQVDVGAMYSIAVLPFTNMSTNEETGFFADGLSEDILDNLAQSKLAFGAQARLKVASRSASFQFTERGEDPSIVGEKLKVAYLLEGSVRQQGENVRITAQLIRTADGFHVWSKSYERTLADGFEMQTAVADNIAHVTNAKLGFDVFRNYGWRRVEAFAGVDPVAIQHFMRATEEFTNMRLGEGGDWRTEIQYLENAVDVDPNFLAAHVRLATAYLTSYATGRQSVHEAGPGAHVAIKSAIALDPDNPSVRFQLAQIQLTFDSDLARAKEGFEQFLKVAPEFGFTHLFLAMIDLREGRVRAALDRIANASELETGGGQQAIFLSFVAGVRLVARDYEGALKASTEALKLALGGQERSPILGNHATSLIMLGRVDEAKPFVEEAWNLNGSTRPEGYVSLFAGIGDIERARGIMTDPRFDLNQSYLATGHLALGDVDSTFDSIRAGIEDHNIGLLTTFPLAEWWDPIRDDPRFDEMLELLDSKVTHTEQYLHDQIVLQDR